MGDSLLLARKVHEVLKGHGFSVKQWQFRGEASGRSEEDLFDDKPNLSGPNLLKGGQNLKVLGIGWSPVEDLVKFEAELNFSPKPFVKTRLSPPAFVEQLAADSSEG